MTNDLLHIFPNPDGTLGFAFNRHLAGIIADPVVRSRVVTPKEREVTVYVGTDTLSFLASERRCPVVKQIVLSACYSEKKIPFRKLTKTELHNYTRGSRK